MKIHTLLEAGTPTLTKHSIGGGTPISAIVDQIRRLGAGPALDRMIKDPHTRLFRGLRGEDSPIIVQDTWSSTRSSQNTSNYVTWLTEVLPSWKSAGLPARSKTVSAHTSRMRAGSYGAGPKYVHVALPTSDSFCVYTGSFDFWEAFDLATREFGGNAVDAVNIGFSSLAQQLGTRCYNSQDVIDLCDHVTRLLHDNPSFYDELPQEIQCILTSHGEMDLFDAVNNMLDPGHMKTTKGGTLNAVTTPDGGQEVAIGGKIVYVSWSVFQDIVDGPQ